MRSLRLGLTPVLGLWLAAACSGQNTGLLDLTLNVDTTNPPPRALVVELKGSGGIHRGLAITFPPDGAASLRLEYPDLPSGTITFTVQTLDGQGCVLGESPAPVAVEIKAGAKVTASTTIRRSTNPCANDGGQTQTLDAGAATGHDTGRADDAGNDGLDSRLVTPAGDVDVGTAGQAIDALLVDTQLVEIRPSDGAADLASEDSDRVVDTFPEGFATEDAPTGSPDAPTPTAPTIISFTASPATISTGASATLTAIFKDATGSSIDHGVGSVTSGNGVGTGTLTATTTYRLTVTDAAGTSVSQEVTVTVVPLPVITSFTALLSTIAVGTLTQLNGIFTGGTGSIDNNIGLVTSGGGVPTGVLTANTTFTLTVTNAAGDSDTKQASVVVSAAVGPGVFTATGSMAVPRSNHTATLLPNGKVLITGGSADTRAEVYDPTTSAFAITGSMRVWRAQHTATLLANGKVIIIGGTEDPVAELYDPTTGTFAATGALFDPRYLHTATLLHNGKVLVAGGGGVTLSQSAYLASAEIYDPATGTFSSTSQMSNPRTFATANLLPTGHVLVAGGWNNTTIAPEGYVATADLWNPSSGLFQPTGPLFYGRAAHTSVSLFSGDVLIVGGVGDDGPTLHAELFAAAKGTFSVSGAEGDERYRHSTTILPSGQVLVAGGTFSNDAALASAEVYERGSGVFTPTAAMTVGRELHTATLLPNGRVLIAGGGTPDPTPTSSAELYY